MAEKEITFPGKIIFKVVYRNTPNIETTIKSCLNENKIEYDLNQKNSNKSNFNSYTIDAFFNSEEELNSICTQLKMIEGFMMMF